MAQPVRVLVIEDRAVDAMLMAVELTRGGFEPSIERVADAAALEAALDRGGWDVILSDYLLPGFKGTDALRRVVEREIDVPFIFVTGTMGEERAVEAMRAGARDYVLKDNMARLPAAVRRELHEAAERRRRGEIERELRVADKRYRVIFESAAAGLLEIDLSKAWAWLCNGGTTVDPERARRVVAGQREDLFEVTQLIDRIDANDAAARLFGLADRKDLLHPGTPRNTNFEGLRHVLLALCEGRQHLQCEIELETVQMHRVPTILSVRLPTDPEDLRYVVVSLLDVTEQRRIEEQMRTAQRLETVGRLAGGVAHDFNNLLTILGTHAEMVARRLPVDHVARADLEVVRDAIDRGAALTRQLLVFSRRQVTKRELVDVNVLVRDLERLLRRLIGEDILFDCRLEDGLGAIKIDPSQMEQVVMNLAVNARDAMPGGGSLLIETAAEALIEGDPRLGVDGAKPGDYVRLSVVDTGCGMDSATVARVFEPFFTTKAPGKGTGLGLSTVYGVVRQAGGFVRLASAVDLGTRVDVFLPRLSGVAAVRAAPRPVRTLIGRERILLVEDEELVRQSARRILEEAGYVVLAAPGGADALAMVTRTGAPPIDLVVSDVVMPGMSGRELVSRLRNDRPTLPALYVSGYAGEGEPLFGEGAGEGAGEAGIDFLAKPFSSQQLLERVRAVLDARVA